MNQLIHEKSPYLQQHGKNPVDWYPWCKKAFDRAKDQGKPVFLSIGYSTCHWCHVMAEESFEDKETADMLNKNYISIKVDREERPDIDSVYMDYCQALTGAGGWPLTIIMTPEQRPFFAGTYLPKHTKYGMPGLLEVLNAVTEHWSTDRKALMEEGEKAAFFLKEKSQRQTEASEPSKEQLYQSVSWFRQNYDKEYGGFGNAPKFPVPHNLLFLLRYGIQERDALARNMAEHTLEQMFRGGIFDHMGGGFSRYSTDEKWLIPHFEKMLYDNALMAYTYLEAYAVTGRVFYKQVAIKTLTYVIRELAGEFGGFVCGQDADSEGVEGKYYVFTPKEMKHVLGEEKGAAFCCYYDITEQGNFEGKNILNLIENSFYEQAVEVMDRFFPQLYHYRRERTLLHKDEKVLTSWNSLMIAALAKAAQVLGNPDYLKKAEETVSFIEEKLTDSSKDLYIRWRDGQAANDGVLDDYAFYGWALLELYGASYEIKYIQKALVILDRMWELFSDPEEGGLYYSSKEGEQLISRPKEVYDGAIPSGNSVAALALGKIAKLTGELKWKKRQEKQLSFLAGAVKKYQTGQSAALLAMMEILYPSEELVCTVASSASLEELKEYLGKSNRMNLTVLVKTCENQQELDKIAPFSKNYPIPEKGIGYYLCRGGRCTARVDNVQSLFHQ